MENQIIEFLEENTELIHIELLFKNVSGYAFKAFYQEEMQEVSIIVAYGNRVFTKTDAAGSWELQDIRVPFNYNQA